MASSDGRKAETISPTGLTGAPKPSLFSVSRAYTLAVDRRFKRDGDATADFINCVSFGRAAEFAEKYLRQGVKIAVTGRIQTGSYTNKDGVRVYTTDVVVEEQEFAESKAASASNSGYQASPSPSPSADIGDGFMNIPDGIDEELPFS